MILVGYSFGGFMTPIVAEVIPERVAHIVNLDGMLPENGKSLTDLIVETWDFFKKKAIEGGHGGGFHPFWSGHSGSLVRTWIGCNPS